MSLPKIDGSQVDLLWRDLQREQGIELALRQRLLHLEAELLDCREAERALRAEHGAGQELEALLAAVEELRRSNAELVEQLESSEATEAQLAMELWRMRVRMESARRSFASQYQ